MNESFASQYLPGTESRPPRLTVIIVNHESWPDVLRLTASLVAEPEFRSGQCQIVVVDNASTRTRPRAVPDPLSGFAAGGPAT